VSAVAKRTILIVASALFATMQVCVALASTPHR
jgi:hypothetical protein